MSGNNMSGSEPLTLCFPKQKRSHMAYLWYSSVETLPNMGRYGSCQWPTDNATQQTVRSSSRHKYFSCMPSPRVSIGCSKAHPFRDKTELWSITQGPFKTRGDLNFGSTKNATAFRPRIFNKCLFSYILNISMISMLEKIGNKSSLMRHFKTTAVAPSIADISGTEDSTLPPNFWCWKSFLLVARLLPLPDGPVASAASAI